VNAASLAAARNDLAAALDPLGYTTHSHVPEQIEPPTVIVQSGDPYLELDGTTFDVTDWLVNVELFVLSAYQANEQATADLDAMLTDVLPAVLAAGWGISSIGAPGPYNTTDWLAYGVRIGLSRGVTIDPT
jgi:hypothetical protein